MFVVLIVNQIVANWQKTKSLWAFLEVHEVSINLKTLQIAEPIYPILQSQLNRLIIF